MQLNKYSSYCNWHKQSTTGIVQFIDMDYILLSIDEFVMMKVQFVQIVFIVFAINMLIIH